MITVGEGSNDSNCVSIIEENARWFARRNGSLRQTSVHLLQAVCRYFSTTETFISILSRGLSFPSLG
jgi:hypothetical protein